VGFLDEKQANRNINIATSNSKKTNHIQNIQKYNNSNKNEDIWVLIKAKKPMVLVFCNQVYVSRRV